MPLRLRDLAVGARDLLRPKGEESGHLPIVGRFLHLMVDMAEHCNLRCTHCAFVWWRDEVLSGKKISPELIARLEREVFPHCWRVSLSCFHEPLVAPSRLISALEACVRAGVIRTDFVTNGLLMTEKLCRQLMETGLRRIQFSVDGASSETYDRVRLGGRFEDFEAKLAMISRVRRELGYDKNRVELSFISCMMKSNVHEAPRLVELAHRHEVDAVELRYLMKSDAAVVSSDELLWNAPEAADRAFDEAIPLAERLGVRLELTPPRFRDLARARGEGAPSPPPPYRDCGFPGNSMVLSPGGDVFPCCLWHGSDSLGNLERKSLDEVWNSLEYRVLRRDLAAGRPARAACRTCIVQRDMQNPNYWDPYPFRR
ncbi:MAG: radical SAM protein [Planctomycetota bacterium]